MGQSQNTFASLGKGCYHRAREPSSQSAASTVGCTSLARFRSLKKLFVLETQTALRNQEGDKTPLQQEEFSRNFRCMCSDVHTLDDRQRYHTPWTDFESPITP